jgi:hypothetical protein
MHRTAEVLSVPLQRTRLTETHDISTYATFAEKYFHGRKWGEYIVSAADQHTASGTSFPVNTVEHLMLTSLLTAQFGFETPMGQVDRHIAHHWNKRVEDPRHQTATTIYMARANRRTIEIKDMMLEKSKLEKELVPGIWGQPFDIKNGSVIPWFTTPDDLSLADLRIIASARLRDYERPIFLPDREMNVRVAEITFENYKNFDNDTADTMSEETFQSDIFPAVRDIVHDITKPKIVFAEP